MSNSANRKEYLAAMGFLPYNPVEMAYEEKMLMGFNVCWQRGQVRSSS
jgi:hypothetical protein